jgi:hypothetical protein
MSEIDEVYAAIEESAGLVGADFSRNTVRPVLTAFRAALPDAGIVFSLSTGASHAGELDYTISLPVALGDPYAIAREHRLVPESDHPVGALLSDLQGRWNINEYLIDCGVVAGFSKVYAHFLHDVQTVPALAAVPSMPPSVAANADFFARHGLADVAMLGIDYPKQTVNLYFQVPAGGLDPAAVRAVLRDLGVPDPAGPLVEYAATSFRVYVTLGWDSDRIERICFAPPPTRGVLTTGRPTPPAVLEPEIEKFVRTAPHTYAGERIVIMAVKWAPDEEYLNLGSYFQLSPIMRKLWLEFYAEEL